MFKKLLLFVLCFVFVVSQGFASDLLDSVPSDATVIIQANIKQLASLPEIKAQLENLVSQNTNYVAQVKEIGFDPMKDVESLVMFLPLDKMNDASNAFDNNIAFILKGKFEVEKVIQSILDKSTENQEVDKKANVTVEDGYNVIILPNEKGEIKMIFFDTATIAIGTSKGVTSIKNVVLGKEKSIKTNKDFYASASKMNFNSTLSAIMALPEEARQYLTANENTKYLSDVQFVGFDFTIIKDVVINVFGDFKATTNMKAVVEGLTKFGQSFKDTKTPHDVLNDLIKNYKVTEKGLTAKVSSLITKDSLIKLGESKQ